MRGLLSRQAKSFRRFLTSDVREAVRSVGNCLETLNYRDELLHAMTICRRHGLLADVARGLDSAEQVLGASLDNEQKGLGGVSRRPRQPPLHVSLIASKESEAE